MGKFSIFLNIILMGIILFMLLDGQAGETASSGEMAEVANRNPMVKEFLEAYPDAKIQGYMISKESLELEELKKDCGPDFLEQSYWRFEYSTEEDKKMILWMDPKKKEVACLVEDLVDKNVVIPFGVQTGSLEREMKKGRTFQETLNFYNINGDKTYYVRIDVLEKPAWQVFIDPVQHLYKPVDRESVKMNAKLEPSQLSVSVPENHPKDMEYIEVEGIEGKVKSIPVHVSFESPKPLPVQEYEPETYNLTLNVTTIYYTGRRPKEEESRIIPYKIKLT